MILKPSLFLLFISASPLFCSDAPKGGVGSACAQSPKASSAPAQDKPIIQVSISNTGSVQVIGLHESGGIFELDIDQTLRKQKAFIKGLELSCQSGKKGYVFRLNSKDEFEFPSEKPLSAAKENSEGVDTIASRLAKLSVEISAPAACATNPKPKEQTKPAAATAVAAANHASPPLPVSPWAESQMRATGHYLFAHQTKVKPDSK